MDILCTPEDRFADLVDYPLAPCYLDTEAVGGVWLRMHLLHYGDEGPRDAAPVLLLHGEPTWSYLCRHMIPGLVQAGHRVVTSDLVGFGKSDKPAARDDYTYQNHVDWLADAVAQLNLLKEVTLFCQDWDGLLGLCLLADMPSRFARAVVANTALPTGDQPMGKALKSWRAFSQSVEDFRSWSRIARTIPRANRTGRPGRS